MVDRRSGRDHRGSLLNVTTWWLYFPRHGKGKSEIVLLIRSGNISCSHITHLILLDPLQHFFVCDGMISLDILSRVFLAAGIRIESEGREMLHISI